MTRIIAIEPVANEPGYTWHAAGNMRHLSLWTLVHRFCQFNVIDGREFKRIFRLTPRSLFRLQGGPEGAVDLRTLEGVNTDELARQLGPGAVQMLQCSAANRHFTRVYASSCLNWTDTEVHLRYCSACIAKGIHLFLHQFVMVQRCPVHGTKLIDRCSKCDSLIPYNVPTESGNFACTCGHVLWPHREHPETCGLSSIAREKYEALGDRFADLYREISHRLNLSGSMRFGASIRLEHDEEQPPKPHWGLSRNELNYWAALYPSAPRMPFNHRSGPGRYMHKTKCRAVPSVSSEFRLRQCSLDERILVYKAIRRYLSRLLRQHRSCIRALSSIGNDGGYDYHLGLRFLRLRVKPSLSPLAAAFVAWRCYWEKSAPYAFSAPRSESYPWHKDACDFPMGPDFDGMYVPDDPPDTTSELNTEQPIHVRFFAARCLGVFEELLMRIDAILKTRTTSVLDIDWIDERCVSPVHVESFRDGAIILSWFPHSNGWRNSKRFNRWLRQVPTRKEIQKYQTRHKDDFKIAGRFTWPKPDGDGLWLIDDVITDDLTIPKPPSSAWERKYWPKRCFW